MSLSQSRVLLTGATGGIGRAIALALSHQGASLLLSGRSPELLQSLTDEIQSRSMIIPAWTVANLGNPEQIEDLAKCAINWNCNTVIHCAGQSGFGSVGDIEVDDLYRLMHLNLLAPMVLTQHLLPHLLKIQHAQMIFVGSVLGAIGIPANSAYCASKFGLRGYSESLRRELGPDSIKVKFFGPRATHTEFNTERVEDFNRLTGAQTDDPFVVAQALVDLMRRDIPEMFIGFPERIAVRLNGVYPSLLDSSFSKHRNAIRTHQTTPSIVN